MEQDLQAGKVLVLYGPRRVGKSTLLEEYLKGLGLKYRLVTGDDLRTREALESQSVKRLQEFAEGLELLAIDEAQRVEGIGYGLKILVDHCPDLRIIATGSASFDLANKVGEPLTGRKKTRILYPLAQMELIEWKSRFEITEMLETFLVYGSYPETLTSRSNRDRVEYLLEVTGSYLFRDILEIERVKNSRLLMDLLRLLAFQIGRDVSLSELGKNLGIDSKTVARYLDLLEKGFVIRSLSGFSRNLRKEVAKSKRYYFLDNGIRNAVINRFNPLRERDDVGELWENFMFIERMKRNEYRRHLASPCFWRTYDQREIDLVEEEGGRL